MNWFRTSSFVSITVVLAFIAVIWYAAAVYLNSAVLIDKYERHKVEWDFSKLVDDSWSMDRPIMPAPHQIYFDLNKSIFKHKISSKRSLVYHGWVTISSTMVGFAMGAILGILLAVGIVHVSTLNKSVLPWIIASQTIPILAIAPMIILV
ncbi:MAG: ABC transporter permease, partial [SAR324 cluster bacterium]|nr:ABC transporter permease [SAR324 cluster bacterium]